VGKSDADQTRGRFFNTGPENHTPRLESFVSKKIEQWLGLKINRDKTRIYEVKAGENGLDFLGYNFSLALAAYGPKRAGTGEWHQARSPYTAKLSNCEP
jgi:hypothetical protein